MPVSSVGRRAATTVCVCQPGERLWTLSKDGHRRYAELRDNGEFGVEFQLFADVNTFLYGKGFNTRAEAMPLAYEERVQRMRQGWILVEPS